MIELSRNAGALKLREENAECETALLGTSQATADQRLFGFAESGISGSESWSDFRKSIRNGDNKRICLLWRATSKQPRDA